MTETVPNAIDCPIKAAVLHTLAYFEIFSYPLRLEELVAFSTKPGISSDQVLEKSKELVEQGLIFQFGAFYQLKNEVTWAPTRLESNRLASAILPKARGMARFIAQFPFVRGVFVSGSLSKHCMRPESDVDFFIVTAPNRLWLARTLLVFFKKIFLFNSHKYFCINYFVDTEHLEIEEKNLFTAMESITLLPMWGQVYYDKFREANTWAWSLFPNFAKRSTDGLAAGSNGLLKQSMEFVLSGAPGNWLERKFMQLTVAFWRRKFSHLDPKTFDLALKSRKGISKHHPLHFQQKVLQRLQQNLEKLNPADKTG